MAYELINKRNYSLENIIYNKNKNILDIYFTEKKIIKKIVSYIQRDYIKYPQYGLEEKTKVIVCKLELTKKALENLYDEEYIGYSKIEARELEDRMVIEKNEYKKCKEILNNFPKPDVICKNAYEIISSIENEIVLPTWYIIEKTKKENSELRTKKRKLEEDNNSCNYRIKLIKKNEIKVINKIDKMDNRSFILTFVTFGYYFSKRRRIKLNKILSKIHFELESVKKEKELILKKIQNIDEKINKNEQYIICMENKKEEESIKELKRIQEDKKIKEKSLSDYKLKEALINNSKWDIFVPIKDYFENEINFEGKSGIYVIKNNILNKYYVGQSHNVAKRIRQHFDKEKYTPKNYIFAQDYYETSLDKRMELFSIKIETCETSLLNEKERESIILYKAFETGYNKTRGNID